MQPATSVWWRIIVERDQEVGLAKSSHQEAHDREGEYIHLGAAFKSFRVNAHSSNGNRLHPSHSNDFKMRIDSDSSSECIQLVFRSEHRGNGRVLVTGPLFGRLFSAVSSSAAPQNLRAETSSPPPPLAPTAPPVTLQPLLSPTKWASSVASSR